MPGSTANSTTRPRTRYGEERWGSNRTLSADADRGSALDGQHHSREERRRVRRNRSTATDDSTDQVRSAASSEDLRAEITGVHKPSHAVGWRMIGFAKRLRARLTRTAHSPRDDDILRPVTFDTRPDRP